MRKVNKTVFVRISLQFYIVYVLYPIHDLKQSCVFFFKTSFIFNSATDWTGLQQLLRIRTSACWLYNAPTSSTSDKQFVVSSCHEKGPRVTVHGSETLC